jgi:hypothetical protein
MKKLGLIVLVAGIVLMAGCAGDDPAGPSGTLADVQNLTIDETASAGQDIVLTWDAVTEAEGYQVYYSTDQSNWSEGPDVTTTTATHTATRAYYYTVKAYDGDNYSTNNSNVVNTMPVDDTVTYTIYDNYSPADKHSGFIFGTSQGGGQTGLASNTSFAQDIYAWDLSKGDEDVWFLSGNYGTYGNGHQTYFYEPQNAGYCPVYGSGTWYGQSYELYTSDDRVFCYLYDGLYAKIYDLDVQQDPDSQNGTMVSFSYEIQLLDGVTVFTDN